MDQRISDSGPVLPVPPAMPAGAVCPFPDVDGAGRRAGISGHGPQEADGRICGISDLPENYAAETEAEVTLNS